MHNHTITSLRNLREYSMHPADWLPPIAHVLRSNGIGPSESYTVPQRFGTGSCSQRAPERNTTRRDTMRHRQSRRWPARRIVLALVLLLMGAVAIREIQDWPVERAMARFRAAPSAQHAVKLTRLLAERAVTPEQGERILRLLFQPKIVTRAAYAVGQPVCISVERPSPLTNAGTRIELREEAWAGGQPMHRGEPSTGAPDNLPEIFMARGLPAQPGVYSGEIRTTCKTINTPIRKPTLWDRLYATLTRRLRRLPAPPGPASVQPTCECRFAVPFDLNVVEGDRAERVERIADPHTDGAIRAAVAVLTTEQRGVYETPTV
jgi:hypothetical protein